MRRRLELDERLLWLVKLAVVAGGVVLSAGLVMNVFDPAGWWAPQLLRGGLVLLMITPALRLLIGVAERIRVRDWAFVLVTLVVILELSVTLWLARNRI